MGRTALLACFVLAGCTTTPPVGVAPRPTPRASVTAAASVVPPLPPTRQGKPFVAGPLPPWLDPDYSESQAPLRARLLQRPRLYGDETNLALNDVTPGNMDRLVIVLEEPRSRDSERVRLLCTTTRERVALYVDRASLGLRTRKGAVIAARRDDLASAMASPASFAGFEADAGVDVGLTRERAEEVSKVVLQSDRTRVEGVVARAQLDEVWEWPASVALPAPNAKILRDATLLDAPHGKPFARLEADPNAYVASVGDKTGDVVFVRVRIHQGIVSGWVPESKVTRTRVGPTARLGGGSSSHFAGSRAIDLPKGTVFHLGGEPIGVAKADTRLSCVRACTETRPVVRVPACGSDVELVAHYPDPRVDASAAPR